MPHLHLSLQSGDENFYRYLDVDGDGIPYRTLPGESAKGSYFTRGSGHNKFGAYTEDAAEYKDGVDRLLIKWETARKLVPGPVIEYSKFNKTAIVSLGSCDAAVKEALTTLKEKNIGLNYCRVKSFPFCDAIREFVDKHDQIYVVEQNRDAQLRSLLMLDAEIPQTKLESMLHYDGMPITASFIIDSVLAEIAKGRAA